MSRVVVLGAACRATPPPLRQEVARPQDEVVVVSPLPHYNWIPRTSGWRRPDDARQGHLPARAGVRAGGIEFSRRGRSRFTRGPRGRPGAVRGRRVHQGGAGRPARGGPLRFPPQRHGPEAELRSDRGPRPGKHSCRCAPSRTPPRPRGRWTRPSSACGAASGSASSSHRPRGARARRGLRVHRQLEFELRARKVRDKADIT